MYCFKPVVTIENKTSITTTSNTYITTVPRTNIYFQSQYKKIFKTIETKTPIKTTSTKALSIELLKTTGEEKIVFKN